MVGDFYWRHGRDNVLTDAGVRMFQILVNHEGEDFDEAKTVIDNEYMLAMGTTEPLRHGGNIQTWIQGFREAGWVELERVAVDKKRLRITDAGKQAHLLLTKLPDFLKVVPYFVIELFSRFQLNNPAHPDATRDTQYDEKLQESNIFPFWTLCKIIYESEKHITSDELKRFVFTLQRAEDIPLVIRQIREYRRDKESGFSGDALTDKYGPIPSGAVFDTKYIMGRFGTHIGSNPSLLVKEGQDTWRMNEAYLPFVETLLKQGPVYSEYISEKAWMAKYGAFVPIDKASLEEDELLPEEILEDDLPNEDPIWLQVKDLLDHGATGIILSGPPGTSKSWYASKIAIKLSGGSTLRHKFIQFHPTYSYEDFIEGYVPRQSSDEDKPFFQLIRKIFLNLCSAATTDPDHRLHILVIDEFTRGDASRVFGELLTYVEKQYRNKAFILPYSGKPTKIPENIVIIGTMNPFDKSVMDLDDAMERRFERVSMEPSIDILKKLVHDAGMHNDLMGKVVGFFNFANQKSPHGFGHTYFLGIKDETDLVRLWNHKLKFLFDKMFRFEQNSYEEVKAEYQKLVLDIRLLK